MRDGMTISAVRPTHWWVLVLLGVISVAAGVLAVSYPDITLRILGLFFGIYLLIAGVAWVAITTDADLSPGMHVLGVIVGFLAVLAGLICIVRPGASVLAVLLAVAFWFVMVGVADLARAFSDAQGRWFYGLFGVLGIAIGVILVSDPDIGLTTVALIAGIGFMVRGVLDIAAGILLRTA